jgi:hypothetical protein
MADFWHTFHHEGKISPFAGEDRGVHAHPISLYLPSRTKLQCITLQLRGQIHPPQIVQYVHNIQLCLPGSGPEVFLIWPGMIPHSYPAQQQQHTV